MTYEHALPDMLGAVDIKSVRLAIAELMDERGWTQQQLADAAGLQQSHVSKIVNVGDDPNEMKDLAARIVFQIIERGFGIRLSDFFMQLEGGLAEGTVIQPAAPARPGSAHEPLPPPTEEDYRAAIRILAQSASTLAERVDAGHHRLPSSDVGATSRQSRPRARSVSRASARTKTGRSAKRD